jgi:solute carrier family 25, member 42
MVEPFLNGVEKRSDHLILDELSEKQSEARTGASSDVISTILFGGIAGAVAKTAIAPAELVKMGFQISSEKFTLTKALKNGIEIFQKGGLFSLWRGHSTTIIRVVPYSGISYAAHDYAEYHCKRHLQTEKLPFLFKFLAGAVGGATATFFTYPLDVLRVRLALTPGATWVSALNSGGIFQGFSAAMLGIIPYSGSAWMVKQILLENFLKVFRRKPNLIESSALNAVVG